VELIYIYILICNFILFAVTDGSSNQTKASVSKLKPKHLSLLVDQPNINLGQLYSLKNVKVEPAVSPGKDISQLKQENVIPVVRSAAISTGKTPLLTELNYDSYAKISDLEDLEVLNYKHKFLHAFDRPIDDLEPKSEVMENLDTAILECNDLVEDPVCHSQELEEELDEPAVETVSVEEEHDDSSFETVASIVPTPEVVQVERYV
jgi:hypothetical protein